MRKHKLRGQNEAKMAARSPIVERSIILGTKVEDGMKIKNREAHLMAAELSKLTGESMTTAVTIALRERLARVRQQQGLSLADRLLAIGRDCAARLKEPFRSADHGDLLYDERGLPR
jgi:antitoxin VapB